MIFSFIAVFGQNNENTARELLDKKKSYILTDISYISDAVFMGRRDSIAAPYIFPSIGYYDKSGIFIDASASYLTSSNESRVDLFLISAGYLFSSHNWSGGISANGYFFNQDSFNVQSEMTAAITGMLSYDLKAFEVSLTASSFFNSESSTDIFGEVLVGRTFYADEKRFLIKPSISIGAGTQNFYEAYYQSSRLGNRKGHGTGGQNQITTSDIMINESSEFNILNLELSLPIQYYYKSFIFSLTPVVAFPQSSATITTEDAVIKEDLESVFYGTVGVSYWFPTKKAND
jgi:hypothetical protein